MITLLNQYINYIRWAVLLLSWIGIAWSVHHIDGISVKAAQFNHDQTVIKSVPEIVTVTQTITKVIHDANDKCASSNMPDALLKQLR